MKSNSPITHDYWNHLWLQFKKRILGHAAVYILVLFILVGIYAPFLAAGKPFSVYYEGTWYFPLFRYLCYPGYYTKNIDIFFNLLIFTFPILILSWRGLRSIPNIRRIVLGLLTFLQLSLFLYCILTPRKDPAADFKLNLEGQLALKSHPYPDWSFDLTYMTPYAKLNLLLKQQKNYIHNQRLLRYKNVYTQYTEGKGMDTTFPTLWEYELQNELEQLANQKKIMESEPHTSESYKYAQAKIKYIHDRRKWIEDNIPQLKYELFPLICYYHWEDDAGGNQSLNQFLPWWQQTRVNRKDLLAALIFGIRISLVVGLLSVGIAMLIGIPIGAFSGYYGGTLDIIVCRLLEIWESMPMFFMLLFIIAILQSKTIFLVILIIGIFGWTSFSRYIRGEFFKQRHLTYVEACKALGFSDSFTIFSHILPNAIPPVLTLLPFAVMGAISSEAGLSFLGLGEEGSCSWGILMDEGRRAFPGESSLLWPPAILLTLLLVAIALIGDTLRDALDPKLQ